MSPWKRALIGSALGALFVLILHPTSRAYYGSFLHLGDSQFLQATSLLPEGVRQMHEPATPADAAYVLLVAAEAEQRAEPLKEKDYRRLLSLARRWQGEEPDNAVWAQMQSVYLSRLGEKDRSERAWEDASRCVRWDDFQTTRLRQIVDGLSKEGGTTMGWQWAYAYQRRSPALTGLLLRHARSLRDRYPPDVPQGLEMRFAILVNGVLIRDGSRSNATGLVGVEMIELASYPPKFAIEVSQKKLLLARQALSNRFRAEGRPEEAQRADRGFRDNDAWVALVRPDVVPETVNRLTWVSLLAASVPGIAVALTGFGILVALLGWAIERSTRLQLVFSTPVAPVLGLGLAVLTFIGTELVFPSLWVVLCLTFFAFAPEHTRKIEPGDLGPLFRFTLVMLGISIVCLLGTFLLGMGTPGVRLLPSLGVPSEYGTGSTLLLGLAGIVFGLVLLTAPAWGIVQRFSPPRLAGLALREFGIGIAVFSFALALVAGPIAVMQDDRIRTQISQLAQNEPVYSQNTEFDQ